MSDKATSASATGWWKETATTTTSVLFVVASVTGVMLLLGIRNGALKSMHEWLGLGFVIAGVIHACRHWGMVLRYLKRANIWVTTVVVTAVAAAFVIFPSAGGGSRGGGGHHAHGRVGSTQQVAPGSETPAGSPATSLEQEAERAGSDAREDQGFVSATQSPPPEEDASGSHA